MSDSFEIPWTVALQAPLFMELSRQEYCSGLPFPSPGDFPKPEIEPESPTLQADSFLTELCRKQSRNLNEVEVYGQMMNDVQAWVWLSMSIGSKDLPSGYFPVPV